MLSKDQVSKPSELEVKELDLSLLNYLFIFTLTLLYSLCCYAHCAKY